MKDKFRTGDKVVYKDGPFKGKHTLITCSRAHRTYYVADNDQVWIEDTFDLVAAKTKPNEGTASAISHEGRNDATNRCCENGWFYDGHECMKQQGAESPLAGTDPDLNRGLSGMDRPDVAGQDREPASGSSESPPEPTESSELEYKIQKIKDSLPRLIEGLEKGGVEWGIGYAQSLLWYLDQDIAFANSIRNANRESPPDAPTESELVKTLKDLIESYEIAFEEMPEIARNMLRGFFLNIEDAKKALRSAQSGVTLTSESESAKAAEAPVVGSFSNFSYGAVDSAHMLKTMDQIESHWFGEWKKTKERIVELEAENDGLKKLSNEAVDKYSKQVDKYVKISDELLRLRESSEKLRAALDGLPAELHDDGCSVYLNERDVKDIKAARAALEGSKKV